MSDKNSGIEVLSALAPQKQVNIHDVIVRSNTTAINNNPYSSSLSCDRFVKEAERRQITSISRTQAWKLEKEGLFPCRIKLLGSRSVVWKLSDLQKWVDKQSNQSTEKPL